MLTKTFEALFRGLIDTFESHHDVPRVPSRVPDLGTTRRSLDEARKAIAEERSRIVPPVSVRPVMPRTVACSDEELARLWVTGLGDIAN